MSTGIYIHVPFCAQKCPYCDFYSGNYSKDRAARYADAVLRNLAALPANLAVDSIYFGGGTPSLLPASMLESFLNAIAVRCRLESPEITIEANPRTMTDEKLRAWHSCGINRLSVGVQSFQDDVLQHLGRNHTGTQAEDAVLRASAAGFRNLSIDLMIGLQEQTTECFTEDLARAVSLPITHFSAYLLKIEDGTPFASAPPALLDDDAMAERYLQMCEFLSAHGFAHYEISNFAQPSFESRHNCKYWRCEPYIGIGPAAHSCFDGKRYAVPRDFERFCASALQPTEITDNAPCRDAERIMLTMRLHSGISRTAFPHLWDIILRKAKPLIPKYLTLQNDTLCLTAEGCLVSNAVIVTILPDEKDGISEENCI